MIYTKNSAVQSLVFVWDFFFFQGGGGGWFVCLFKSLFTKSFTDTDYIGDETGENERAENHKLCIYERKKV